MLLEAVYRRFQVMRAGKAPVDFRATGLESMPVDQVAPPDMESARSGRRFWLGYSAAPTGIAPVQALATTVAHWAIYNPSDMSYWLTELGAWITSGTPAAGGSLYACLFQLPWYTGVSAAGIGVGSANSSSRSSSAIIKSNITITTPAAPVWRLVAKNDSANVGAFGTGSGTLLNQALSGRIAIRPNWALGLYVLAGTGTTPLYAPSAEWFEAEADME